MRLWLIRHGEPHPDTRGRCYGRLDVGLSDTGRQQMERVAAELARENLARICTSPRKRTMQSATIVAAQQSCEIQTVDDLREIDFGDFEGLTYDEIAATRPEIYRRWMETPTEVHFPNGESFVLMRERVTRAISALIGAHAGESVAVVTHGGAIRIVLAETLSIPAAAIFRIGQRYAALNLIRYVEGHPIVELMNG